MQTVRVCWAAAEANVSRRIFLLKRLFFFHLVGRLTRSLPLTRPPTFPSVSLASPPLHSVKRHSNVSSCKRRLIQGPYNLLVVTQADRDRVAALALRKVIAA